MRRLRSARIRIELIHPLVSISVINDVGRTHINYSHGGPGTSVLWQLHSGFMDVAMTRRFIHIIKLSVLASVPRPCTAGIRRDTYVLMRGLIIESTIMAMRLWFLLIQQIFPVDCLRSSKNSHTAAPTDDLINKDQLKMSSLKTYKI